MSRQRWIYTPCETPTGLAAASIVHVSNCMFIRGERSGGVSEVFRSENELWMYKYLVLIIIESNMDRLRYVFVRDINIFFRLEYYIEPL